MNHVVVHPSTDGESQVAIDWIEAYRESVDCTVERIAFADSQQWYFDQDKSALRHRSGKFFAIQGYQATLDGNTTHYQPLINQPEIGTQGFIVRRNGSDFDVLIQTRTEPGNIGVVQIGPTIQATFSNYTAVHGGKKPLFLDTFHHPERHGATVLVDTTQPELGTKFLKKWNRNMVIEVPDLDFSHPMFKWISLSALTRLMKIDHLVNNDARLVVGLLLLDQAGPLYAASPSPLTRSVCDSFLSPSSSTFGTVAEAQDWLNRLRLQRGLQVQVKSLNDLPGWEIGHDRVQHTAARFFSVIQVRVHAADREVTDWDQPLIAADHKAEVTLLCKTIDGVLNLLFRAENQIGNANGVQLQPTICFDNEGNDTVVGAVSELLSQSHPLEQFQMEASDEGGRFYQCISRYKVLWLSGQANTALPDHYCWLTLGQIRQLIQNTDSISDESRSILSLFLASAFSNSMLS